MSSSEATIDDTTSTGDVVTTTEAAATAEKPRKSKLGGVPLRDIYRMFRPHLVAHRRLFIASIVLVVVATAVGLLKPWPLKYLFDDVLLTESAPGAPEATSAAGGADVQQTLLLVVLAIAMITLVNSLLTFAREYVLTGLGESVSTSVRYRMYKHLQSLSMRFHLKSRAGDTLTRLTTDVDKVQSIITVTVIDAGANILMLVGMMSIMFFLDWQLSLVMLALFPVLVLVVQRFKARIKKAESDVRESEGDIASLAEETLSAMTLVKAYGLEAHEAERLRVRAWQNFGQEMKVLRVSGLFTVVLDMVTAIALAGLIWIGAQRVLSGALTPGELIIIVAYLADVISPARSLAKLPAKLAKASVRAEKIFEILNAVPDVVDKPDAIAAPPLNGRIELRKVTFGYDPETPVLREVDIDVAPGQTVAIVGATGAGKSTLVGLLLRLYDPDSGSVVIDGTDLRDFALQTYQNQLAVVLQQTMLFHTTVRENIAYGRPNATDAEIEAAARIAAAHEFISELPDGYDTVLGEKGATLSGGQRQRLSIARAVLRDGRLLILDEPTTGLDARCERDVMDAINRVTSGRTTVIISHQLSAVLRADQIVVLDAGRVVERGTHAELLALDGRYADLARLQGLIRIDSGRPKQLIDEVFAQHRVDRDTLTHQRTATLTLHKNGHHLNGEHT
ncbi:MAG: ABC transporter ATP-binding protein [Sporichthyaceae bacterium]